MVYKYLSVLIFIFASNNLFAQRELRAIDKKTPSNTNYYNEKASDTLSDRNSKKVAKNLKAKIEDYKIISYKRDTVNLDTTLTINKEYKFNYLRRDYFELLPFNNMGQTYNSLSENLYRRGIQPRLGSKAKHFNYIGLKDINYYRVPTPLTELMFKSNFEQGQLLDAFFTVNTSDQFNFSIAYKGMRSLGKYQHILSSIGNFRFTTNYNTKNKRYYLRAHIASQDIVNQENGGISDEQSLDFENGNPEFIDRSLFDPLFEDAENKLKGRRLYVEHTYQFKLKDSLGNNGIKFGNIFHLEDKFYQFKQDRNSAIYGDAFVTSDLFDKNIFKHFYGDLSSEYNNNTLGVFKAKLGYNQFNYGYNSLVILNDQTISNRLIENSVFFEGGYENKIGSISLKADLGFNITGDIDGNFIDLQANSVLSDDFNASAHLNLNSSVADYNYRLYQSDYLNYNWQNSFKNQQSKQLALNLNSKKYGELSADYTLVNEYLYFEDKGSGVKPYQYNGTINYMRIKYEKEFKFKNFGLYNTIMYQQVFDNNKVLNIPEINTRHTFYYANELFKKALFLQTGFTVSYFSKYFMNAYDPVIAEFYVQNESYYGNFPRIDFFINAKIQQTRLFLKAEHFNSSMTGYNFYSAPNYPYRDFIVRFGIVWNFFL